MMVSISHRVITWIYPRSIISKAESESSCNCISGAIIYAKAIFHGFFTCR